MSSAQIPELGFVHRFVPGVRTNLTLLLLHGTGGNEDDLMPLGNRLFPGAALLSPRGKVLERGMPRFFRRLAEGVFDVQDIRLRARELAQFLTDASARYALDPAMIVAVGYSNGANIAAALLLLEPRALAGAVLLRAMVPLEPDPLPDLSASKAFMAAGQYDAMIPQRETERLADLLRSCRADVSLNVYPQGHELGPEELQAARSWLSQNWPASAQER